MDLHLDAQTEQRIQHEIDLGHFREPSEVIAHALTLLDSQEHWRNRGSHWNIATGGKQSESTLQ